MNIDFVNPDVPRALKIVNRLARPFARALLPLDPDRLIRSAQEKTDLRDLGDDGFRRPLRILTESLE